MFYATATEKRYFIVTLELSWTDTTENTAKGIKSYKSNKFELLKEKERGEPTEKPPEHFQKEAH